MERRAVGWRAVAFMGTAGLVSCVVGVAPFAGASTTGRSATAVPFTLAADVHFAGDGVLELPGWDDVGELVAANDGSTLATLERRDAGGAVVDRGVARVRADGTLDPTLGASGATPGIVDVGSRSGHLALRADGRFLIGSTQFRADGSVDIGFGISGSISIAGPVGGYLTFGNVALTMFETATHQLVFVSSDGAIYRIDDQGVVVPGPDLGGGGGEAARAFPWSNGETLVVSHAYAGGFRIVFVRADGRIDTAFGDANHGISVPAIAASGAMLGAAPSSTGGLLLFVDRFLEHSTLIAVHLDGTRDTSLAPNGEWGFDGSGNGVSASPDGGAWVGIWYSYAVHSTAPYHPAVVRLTPAGAVDPQFNPNGLRRGSLDLTEVGIAVDAIARPLVAFGDGVLLGIGELAPGGGEHLAALVDLQPVAPPVTAPSSTLPVRPSPVVPSIEGGAAATKPAIRIPPQPRPPR